MLSCDACIAWGFQACFTIRESSTEQVLVATRACFELQCCTTCEIFTNPYLLQ
jgi:hypothetical protein